MKIFFIGALFTLTMSLHAQTLSPAEVIHTFFQAMYESDTSTLSSIISDELELNSSYLKDGSGIIKKGSRASFFNSIGASTPGSLDEKISNLIVEQRNGLANVWMDYAFYLNGVFSHCGVNNFTMAMKGSKWEIISIADTRDKSDCQIEMTRQEINTFMNNWHLAATNADSIGFFTKMAKDAIYVGTDASEVWSKNEFLKFASPYFKRGRAWDFKTISRNIYAGDFSKRVWFDEMLDTWMGPCRGSGIIERENDEWKIKHYVLSVTVANDDIQEFISLLKKN